MSVEEEFVDELLERPHRSEGDLRARIGERDGDRVRDALVRRVTTGGVPPGQLPAAHDALSILGVRSLLPAILEAMVDADLDLDSRAVLASLARVEDPEVTDRMTAALPESDRAALVHHVGLQGLRSMNEEERQEFVQELLRSAVRRGDSDFRLEQAESLRKALGISAESFYGRAHRDPKLGPLRARIRKIRAGDARPAAPGGADYALVSTCDGEGAFVMIACLRAGRDRWNVANLVVRASGGLRDGFFVSLLSSSEVDDLREKLEKADTMTFTRVPVAEAAELAEEGHLRTIALKLGLPRDAVEPLRVLRRLRAKQTVLPDPPPSRDEPTLEEVRSLLADPALRSWFFDGDDLRPRGIRPPDVGVGRGRWVEDALRDLDGSLATRVAAMAAFMARYHTWDGRPDRASRFAALSRLTPETFTRSPLVRAILERTYDVYTSRPEDGASPPADRREEIRSSLLADVENPLGQDLLALDLLEVLVAALDGSRRFAPVDHEPLREQVLDAAGEVFEILVGAPASGEAGSAEDHASIVERTRGLLESRLGIGATAAELAALHVHDAVDRFSSQVCARCPVRCVDDLDGDFSEAFYASEHPAAAVIARLRSAANDEDELDGDDLDFEDEDFVFIDEVWRTVADWKAELGADELDDAPLCWSAQFTTLLGLVEVDSEVDPRAEAVLRNDFPRHVCYRPEQAPAVVTALRGLRDRLVSQGVLDPENWPFLDAPDLAGHLARRGADPSSFHAKKAVMMDGYAGGHDVSTYRGQAVWRDELGRRWAVEDARKRQSAARKVRRQVGKKGRKGRKGR